MPGIELDVNAGPLEVMASIGVELGRMNDRADEAARAEKRHRDQLRAQVPSDVRFWASGICPTPTAPFGLTFDGPEAGFYWIVRRVTVGGISFATVAAGSYEAYITGTAGIRGGADPNGIAATRPISNIVDAFATLPRIATFGTHEIVLHAGENFVVVVAGGTAGQQYTASCLCEVHRTVAAPEEYTA